MNIIIPLILLFVIVVLYVLFTQRNKSKSKKVIKEQLPVENPEVELPSITPSPQTSPLSCFLYNLSVNSGISARFSYVDCNGNAANILVPAGDFPTICSSTTPINFEGDGNIVNTSTPCHPTLLAKKVQKKK
jgi:hypothetical protein